MPSSLLLPPVYPDPVTGPTALRVYGGPYGANITNESPTELLKYREGAREFNLAGFRTPDTVPHDPDVERVVGRTTTRYEDLQPNTQYIVGTDNWNPYTITHEGRHGVLTGEDTIHYTGNYRAHDAEESEARLWDAFRALGTDDWEQARDQFIAHYKRMFPKHYEHIKTDEQKEKLMMELLKDHRDDLIDKEAGAYAQDYWKEEGGNKEAHTKGRIAAFTDYFKRLKRHRESGE